MRVLVVSEDARERSRAVSALRLREGAEVSQATTAAEGKAVASQQEFDVLVIDGDLAPQGGFSLLYELRAAAELRGVPTPPALVMTAREQDRFLSDWSGANALIRKPVDPFDLARTVRSLAGAEPAERAPTDAAAQQVADAVGAEGSGGLTPVD